jgi:hypothetical protein
MKLQAIAAAAALAAVSPAIALAAGDAPVAIVSSHVQPASAGSALPEPGSVQFSFVNQSRVPATEVDFAFTSYGEIVGTYRDVGSFAQGVTIDRSFGTDRTAPNEQVAVAAVKYADGSVWLNDNAPASARRQATVSLFTK